MTYRRWLILCLLSVPQVFAQSVATPLAFEVATIKPVAPDAKVTFVGVMDSPDGIDAENVSLPMLIRRAYGGKELRMDDQVVGAPAWSKTQRYNIRAKFTEADAIELKTLSPQERNDRIGSMLQSLLADRFALQAHPSTAEFRDFELVVAKSGFKLKPVSDTGPVEIKGRDGQSLRGSIARYMRDGTANFQEYSMDQFAGVLTTQAAELGRMVVNKTELPGTYTFTLNWVPGPRPDGAPGLTTVLQEELGLRLQPSVATAAVFIIDHVEKPTPN